MGFIKVAMVMTVMVALIAYISMPRLPENMKNNRRAKEIQGTIHNIANYVLYALSLVGVDTVSILKSFVQKAAAGIPATPDDILETRTTIEGVDVVIFQPSAKSTELRPGLIYIHGGGWMILSPHHYAPLCRKLVRETQSVIVSIDYRMSPEHVFPAAVIDNLKVARYFIDNAEKYGVDGERIGIRGDSAGGNLALIVALNFTSDGFQPKHALKSMMLDYPALQAVDLGLPSYQKYGDGPCILNSDSMMMFYVYYAFGTGEFIELFKANDHLRPEVREQVKDRISLNFLPKEFKSDPKTMSSHPSPSNSRLKNSDVTKRIQDIVMDPWFSPLLASDEQLSRLPPTRVMVTECDVLRDDALIFIERMKRIGANIEDSYLADEQHGFTSSDDGTEPHDQQIKAFGVFYNKTTSKL